MGELREKHVVLGGGLVGAVWSLFLARRGLPVRLYELRPDPRISPEHSGRSAHLVISERGWKALRAVGLEELVRSIAMPLEGRQVHTEQGGLDFFPYGTQDQAIWAVNRVRLNQALTESVAAHPNIQISFESRCTNVDLERGALRFTHTRTGEEREVLAELIFAADGAFSRVRQAMTRLNRFDYSQSYFRHGYKELSVHGTAGGSSLLRTRMHVWPRGQLMLSAFPNQDGTFTSVLLLPFEPPEAGTASQHPSSRHSFEGLRTPEDVLALFKEFFPDALPHMPNLVEEFFSRPAVSIPTIRCYPWVYKGRVALIGDAAHSITPFFGQGMNCGFEDCSVLDSLLDRYPGNWPEVLAQYQRLRKPNADAVSDMSNENFSELADKVGDPRFMLQKRLERKIQKLHPDRFIPLYPMVAFTHLPYARIRERTQAQDAIVRELMALPNIEARWDSPEVEKLISVLVLDGREGGPAPLRPFNENE